MPIAALAPAIIGGVAAVGGAAISASATKKATGAAADAAARNEAMIREQRQQDQQNFQPYLSAGYSGLDALMRELGITPRGQQSGGTDFGAYVQNQPDVLANWNALTPDQKAQFNNDPAQFGQFHYNDSQARGETRDLTPYTQQGQARDPLSVPGVGARPESPTRPTSQAPNLPASPNIEMRGAPTGPTNLPQRSTPTPRPAIGPPAATAGATGAPAASAGGGGSGGGSAYSGLLNPPGGSSASGGPNYGDRPEIAAYTQGQGPTLDGFTFRDREADPTLDLSVDRFRTQDPAYEFAQTEAQRGVLAAYGDMFESGAAMKALQDRRQNVADSRYRDWADTERGQFNIDRGVRDARYEGDRGAALSAWGTKGALDQQAFDNREGRALSAWGTTQGLTQEGYTADMARQSGDWQARLADEGATRRTGMQEAGATERANISESGANSRAALSEQGTNSRYYAGLTQAAYDSDQDRADRRYEYDTGNALDMYKFNTTTGENRYVYDTGRADRAREFDTGTALDLYKYQDTAANDRFEIDRARNDAIYDSDRGYLTNRYDTLLDRYTQVAGMGQNAAGAIAGSGQNAVSNLTANNSALAGVRGNAAIANANTVNGIMGSALNAYALYRGGQNGGYGSPSNRTYDI